MPARLGHGIDDLPRVERYRPAPNPEVTARFTQDEWLFEGPHEANP